ALVCRAKELAQIGQVGSKPYVCITKFTFSGSLSDHIVDWLRKNVNNAEYSLFEYDEEESWLKEFIDAFKHIQKNVVDISIESMTETEWYIDVLNPLLKTSVSGLKDESYTESSQQ
ncbi:18275_t:CDS:2, partial [Gigaspora margarita]